MEVVTKRTITAGIIKPAIWSNLTGLEVKQTKLKTESETGEKCGPAQPAGRYLT